RVRARPLLERDRCRHRQTGAAALARAAPEERRAREGGRLRRRAEPRRALGPEALGGVREGARPLVPEARRAGHALRGRERPRAAEGDNVTRVEVASFDYREALASVRTMLAEAGSAAAVEIAEVRARRHHVLAVA